MKSLTLEQREFIIAKCEELDFENSYNDESCMYYDGRKMTDEELIYCFIALSMNPNKGA